jgi:hypothetical protein
MATYQVAAGGRAWRRDRGGPEQPGELYRAADRRECFAERHCLPQDGELLAGVEQELAKNLVAAVTFLGGHSYDQLYEANYNALAAACRALRSLAASSTRARGRSRITRRWWRASAIASRRCSIRRPSPGDIRWIQQLPGHRLHPMPARRITLRARSDVNGHYSNAAIDVRDRFTFSGMYEVPHYFTSDCLNQLSSGWTGAGLAVAQSGTPFSMYASTPYNGTVNGGGHPGPGAGCRARGGASVQPLAVPDLYAGGADQAMTFRRRGRPRTAMRRATRS